MLLFVFQKIRNKKWLNLSLAVGILLLMTVFACHPILQERSDNQMLSAGFEDYAEENNQFPAALLRSDSYLTTEYPDADSVLAKMKQYEAKWMEYVDLKQINSQHILTLSGSSTESNLGGNNRLFHIGFMENMEEHIEIVKEPSSVETSPENACYVSESVMDDYGLMVGEEITFSHIANRQGENMKLVIAGIIREKDTGDNFWYYNLEHYEKTLFVSQTVFDSLLEEYEFSQITWDEVLLLDYRGIVSENALVYKEYLDSFSKLDAFFSTNLKDQLVEFERQHDKTQMILWVIELPCMVLLLLFIYMVSKQIVELEEGEIAVLRSRGTTRWQIIKLYLLQAITLSIGGIAAGCCLGIRVVPYVLAAMLIAVVFMLLPVWKKSIFTIVEQKSQNKYLVKKPFWQKFFLDFLLLGVSVYLLFNYYKQKDTLSETILLGEALDPVLFLDSSLFLFAGSLVFIRVVGYVIKGIYHLGKKVWKPGMYAAFLQMIRTFHRQSLLWVFLIVTIASGIFQNNMAKTVNQNQTERTIYDAGADIKLMEKWNLRVWLNNGEWMWNYTEPSYEFYVKQKDAGTFSSVTKVLEDANIDVSGKGKSIKGCNLMAISTKEFGETAYLKDGLNNEHWYHSLNALAQDAEGAIISKNMAERMELSVGDEFTYSRYSPVSFQQEQIMGVDTVKVCAIVEAFPGFDQYLEDGTENYLVVCNIASVIGEFGLTPYSVWGRLEEDVSASKVKENAETEGITFISWNALEENLEENQGSSLIQVTNTLFRISFIISMIICVTGYLIYWVMSIQSRELLFGIYRAMGMGIRKVYGMVFTEQLLCFMGALTAGGVLGMLASVFFIPLLAIVYLPQKHNVSIEMYFLGTDLLQTGAVLLVAAVGCFLVILRILKNMKIAQALKMGED